MFLCISKLRKTTFTWIIVVLCFVIPHSIKAQNGTISPGINLLVNYGKLGTGLGLNLAGEYMINEQYALRLNTGFLFSAFDHQEYFATDPYSVIFFEGNGLYYFNKTTVQPYIGLGFGYYIPNTHLGGMPHSLFSQALARGNDLFSNFGINTLGGLLISPDNPISFKLELKYTYFRTEWTARIEDGNLDPSEYELRDRINLSMFVTNLSIILHL